MHQRVHDHQLIWNLFSVRCIYDRYTEDSTEIVFIFQRELIDRNFFIPLSLTKRFPWNLETCPNLIYFLKHTFEITLLTSNKGRLPNIRPTIPLILPPSPPPTPSLLWFCVLKSVESSLECSVKVSRGLSLLANLYWRVVVRRKCSVATLKSVWKGRQICITTDANK